MNKDLLKHKLILGKYRMIYLYAFIGLVAATVFIGMLLPNTRLIFGACAFTALILFIVDISNVKRFGSFYGIDVIDNQIIEMSEKGGERIVRPEDITEIVQPVDLNLTGPGKANHEERYFYIKLRDGGTLSVSGMVSDYDELVNKIKNFSLQNNLTERAKITGIL
jgi:hypothetical protein